MKSLTAWFAAARWRLSLSHCLAALLIQIPLGLLIDFRVGALAVVAWYWSRKTLEVQLAGKVKGASDATVWSVGLFPWTWDRYKVLDLALPALSSTMLAWAALAYRGPLVL